jgi:hypothetical protein
MGLLFTSDGTRRIIDTLNTAFDGPSPAGGPAIGLDFIRTKADAKILTKIGKRNWAPGHLTRMLKLLPFDQHTGAADLPNETKKWWWFVRKLVGNSATFGPIRTALADAIFKQDSYNGNAPLNIVRVSFDHVELPASTNPLIPDPNPNVVIFDAPLPGAAGGGLVRNITLFTVNAKLDDTPPPLSGDEQDISVKPPWVHP